MSDQSQPPVPPVPPPVPQPVAQPQYGEYAPGYVPPAPGTAAPPAAPAQTYGVAPQQPGRTRKTWDLVLTVVLYVLGLFGMLIGVFYGFVFSDPAMLNQALQQQGYGPITGGTGAAPAVLIASHVILYLIAIGGSLPLLISKRVAFWVPLACGVIAAIVFWGTLFAVIASAPGVLPTN
ncbi:MAG: hypothetical protein KF727_07625 [Microbacteriaceae bacterium]|nr:hypothetical protein [Microbacteriaceae bacterium]